jgi:tetratricopeptide (TPR) repeat protein
MSRQAWRDIPVAMPGPFSEHAELTVLLPETDQPYTLVGKSAFETELASVRLARKAELQGARLTIVDTTAWPGGELAPAQVSAERQKASRFGAADLSLRAPRGVARRFDAAMRGDRRRFAAIEAAYSRAIERDPDSVENHRNRARFRLHTWDWNGALEDLDTILEREPSAPDYIDRARLRAEMGHLEAALTDAEAAWELDQSLPSAFMLSGRLAELGRTEDALALLQEQPAAAEQQQGLALAISELEAQSGRKEEGFQRIDDLVAQRPNDPQLLNAKCWYQATWNYQPDTLEDVCTEAVEKADSSAMVLDSRAMGYYRLGRYQDALKDLESALSASPETAPTLFMRGVVRLQLGDSGGAQDVEEALAREPSLKRSYGRFGITTQ